MKKIVLLFALIMCCFSITACSESTVQNDETIVEEPVIETYEIGETVETDMVSFTMDKYEITDKVGLDYSYWLKPYAGKGGIVPGGDGTFLWFSFSVDNNSKEKLSGYDVCNIAVDYNNGYIFEDGVYASPHLVGYSTSRGISSSVGLPSIKPLASENFYGYIECAGDVRDDETAPVSLIVTLPSSQGDVEFIYVIR